MNIFFLIQIIFIFLTNYSSITSGSQFTKLLALGSVQFGGIVDTSSLPPLSKNINPPTPEISEQTNIPLCVSLSAGLCETCLNI